MHHSCFVLVDSLFYYTMERGISLLLLFFVFWCCSSTKFLVPWETTVYHVLLYRATWKRNTTSQSKRRCNVNQWSLLVHCDLLLFNNFSFFYFICHVSISLYYYIYHYMLFFIKKFFFLIYTSLFFICINVFYISPSLYMFVSVYLRLNKDQLWHRNRL